MMHIQGSVVCHVLRMWALMRGPVVSESRPMVIDPLGMCHMGVTGGDGLTIL